MFSDSLLNEFLALFSTLLFRKFGCSGLVSNLPLCVNVQLLLCSLALVCCSTLPWRKGKATCREKIFRDPKDTLRSWTSSVRSKCKPVLCLCSSPPWLISLNTCL